MTLADVVRMLGVDAGVGAGDSIRLVSRTRNSHWIVTTTAGERLVLGRYDRRRSREEIAFEHRVPTTCTVAVPHT